MSIQYSLFKALKYLSPDNYKITFGVVEGNKEGVCGIYISGGIPSNRRVEDGKYLVRTASVTYNIRGERDKIVDGTRLQGVVEGFRYCEKVVETLSTTSNYTFTDGDDFVSIQSVEVLGDVNYLGFDNYDIPIYSINFMIKYQGGQSNVSSS